MTNMCEVEFAVTLLVPVKARTRPAAREEAEAAVEHDLTDLHINDVFRKYGVGDTGYTLRHGHCHIQHDVRTSRWDTEPYKELNERKGIYDWSRGKDK